jgi:hypothetical protein
MTIKQSKDGINHHWNYYLALEEDMERVSRFIEFSEKNYCVYSIELAHILFTASSEFEIVARMLCAELDRNAKRENINEIRRVLMKHVPEIAKETIYVDRYCLTLDTPLENFAIGKSPRWWDSYNAVKHNRNEKFEHATLENALQALASLLIVALYYEKARKQSINFNEAVKTLKPESSLLRFNPHYYDDIQLVL